MKKLDNRQRLVVKGAINQLQLSLIDADPTHALGQAAGYVNTLLQMAAVEKPSADKLSPAPGK